MQVNTLFFLILAAVSALLVVFFRYYYKNKRKGKLPALLSILRFLSIFGLLVLCINPKFKKKEFTLAKTNLVLLVDNSASIKDLKGENVVKSVLTTIEVDNAVQNRFTIDKYGFDTSLNELDTLVFTKKGTDIGGALQTVTDIYKTENTIVLLLSDGNQTLGTDYEFFGSNTNLPIYTVVVGDTTKHEDVSIGPVNINKYAFLGNKYPVEAFLSYEGENTINTTVSIANNGRKVYSERITFSKDDNTKSITTLLEAKNVGRQNLNISISQLPAEQNTTNNRRNISIEVVDEKTNVAIVSTLMHPDIGALKRAIESNEQREVSVINPKSSTETWKSIDLFILYQPNPSFESIYKYIAREKASTLSIIGKNVNRNFLNTIQDGFVITGNYPVQETFPVVNTAFSKFDVSEFNTADFPPLQNGVGTIETKGETLLGMRIMGVDLNAPLLTVIDDKDRKEVILFGEDIWKWRMQSYKNQQDFKNFDDFVGRLLRYLTTSKSKSRFELDYASVFEGSYNAIIKAKLFDEALVFDSNANINLTLIAVNSDVKKIIPMILDGSNYKADLSDFAPGKYNFTAKVEGQGLAKAGSFEILDFDIEKQFLHSNHLKLKRLSDNTGGQFYYPSDIEELKEHLLDSNQYLPVQKSKEKVVPLIDFKILLGLIIFTFSLEWIIRKYNGLT